MQNDMDNLSSGSDDWRKDSANARSLAVLHIFLCSIGWIISLYFLCIEIARGLAQSQAQIVIKGGFSYLFFPEKRFVMTGYACVLVGLFLYYAVTYFLLFRVNRIEELFHEEAFGGRKKRYFYIGLVLAVNCAAGCLPVIYRSINVDGAGRAVSLLCTVGTYMLIWLAVAVFPFRITLRRSEWFVSGGIAASKPLIYGILVVASIQMVAMFAPFVFGKLRMINEYLDIPEQTILGQKYVDNGKYLKSHDLVGLQKYDLETGTVDYQSDASIAVPESELLRSFIRNWNARDDLESRYCYDSKSGMLNLIGEMSLEERQDLQTVLGGRYSEEIGRMVFRSQEKARIIRKGELSTEEAQFLEKNRFELIWQLRNRWVIHHTGFILIPAMEYSLGKPWKQIFAQYGLPNTIVAAELMKTLGGISYQNYFKVWYVFYLLYYGIFLWLLFILFRKQIVYVTIAWVLTVACLGCLRYEFIFLGPGLSPIRHFFDVFVILFLYLYLENKKTYLLVPASLAGVLGVVNNSQLGIICMAAFVLTMGIVALREGSYRRFMSVSVLFAAIALAAFAFYESMHTYDPVSKYYKAGLLGFSIPVIGILVIFIFFSLGYLVLLTQRRNWDHESYIAMFLLFLSQGYMVYFIWGGTSPHFLNMAPLYAVAAIKLLQVVFARGERSRDIQKLVVSSLMVLSLAIFVLSLGAFYCSMHQYNNVFTSHKTYDWKFETASFESTMDPEYFRQAVGLIDKYAHAAGSIHMISKYDSFLGVLSKKYSAMSFFDLQWFLMTKNETAGAIEALQEAAPEYLFVDSDIDQCKNPEMIPSYAPMLGDLHCESVMRIDRLNEMQCVFDAIKDRYEPVERGWLITVYKRKSVAVNSQASVKE
jgi:hypothetical protein